MYPLAHVSKRASAETGDRDRAKFATGGGGEDSRSQSPARCWRPHEGDACMADVLGRGCDWEMQEWKTAASR
jgi:hypothetical protein